ncbi:MAG TPA: VWA domain-containing protein [Pyrinomonadaceae bacterium]|jgi:Ca-activated chloride channel family protein|nr:VWA domain-containing protein [Pyrinomonadaceae bacterium]
MAQQKVHRKVSRTRSLVALVFALASVAALAVPAVRTTAQQRTQTDARPRRVQTVAPQTSATPMPTPFPRVNPPAATSTQRPAQPTASPAPTPPELRQQGEEVDDEDTVRVESNLVNLQVRVIDRNNRPINDVRQEDFRIFENGEPQTVTYFSKEEVPISYGLVVDNSGSLRTQLPKVIEAGKTIVNSNKPGDETFLVRFVDSEKIETVQDFTSNQNDLLDALETLYTEGGQTAVLDAVYLTAERVANYKKGNSLNDRRRRALILVTDGEDRDSFYKQDQLFATLRENDVQIYVIGFIGELDKEGGFIRKSPRERAVNLVNRLAKETGGRAFFPNSLSELPQIAEEITRDMRTQYVISYNPTNKARDGSYRAVKVTIADASGKDKRIALTRAGYTAPRDGSAPATNAPPAKSNDPRSTSVSKP